VPIAARVARNESLFREVNERIHELEESFGARAPGADMASFVCECATEGCATRVQMTLDEYQLARRRPTRFLVAPGHARPDFERIVWRTDRFELVEKFGEAGEVATELAD
jgi:hypothetical protein